MKARLFEKCNLSRGKERSWRMVKGTISEADLKVQRRRNPVAKRAIPLESHEDPAKSREALGGILASDYHILVVWQANSDVLGLSPRLHLEKVLLALHDHGHHGDTVLGFYAVRWRPEAVLRDMAACVKRVLLVLRLQHEHIHTHTVGDEFTQRESMRGACWRGLRDLSLSGNQDRCDRCEQGWNERRVLDIDIVASVRCSGIAYVLSHQRRDSNIRKIFPREI